MISDFFASIESNITKIKQNEESIRKTKDELKKFENNTKKQQNMFEFLKFNDELDLKHKKIKELQNQNDDLSRMNEEEIPKKISHVLANDILKYHHDKNRRRKNLRKFVGVGVSAVSAAILIFFVKRRNK